MKQVVRKGIREMVVEEIPDPVAGPYQVLVRPLYSLISPGTETASIHQEGVMKEVTGNPSRLRQVWDVMKAAGPRDTIREVRAKLDSELAALGYSGAGIVVERHPTVTDLEPGDRVAYGGEGTGHAETIITGRNLVARIPDGVGCEHACFATLGAIALHSVRLAELSLGDTVAVIGLGLVGQLVAQLARLQGGRVFALDLRPERVKLATELGAEGILGGAGAREAILQATGGRGVDCVIVAAAAKSSVPCRQGVELCRDRGRMVVVGAVEMDLPRDEMYVKEIRLTLSRAYGPGSYDPAYEKQGRDYPFSYVRWTENRNMEEFLRQIGTGGLKLDPLVTHEFPLERGPEAYQVIMTPGTTSLAVRLKYRAAEESDPLGGFAARRRVELPAGAVAAPAGAIQVALAGAGNLARWSHLPNMQKLPGVVLRAVQSGGGVRAANHGQRFGAGYATTEFDELLRDASVDVVMIMSQHSHHARQAVAALRAGKHVFLEKPMAITEEEGRQVLQAVRETGRQLMVGFNRRFAPFYVAVKAEVSRRAGPVVINCRMNSPGIAGGHWAADRAQGGAVLGEGCHFADLMYWLLESEPVRVSARTLMVDQAGAAGEDSLAAVLEFADGSIANLTYCTVGSKSSGGERLEVFGAGFGVETENFQTLTVKRGLVRTSRKFFPDKGYKEQLEGFFQALRKGQAPPITAEDGMRATVVCLRMLEASRKRETLTVDWKAAAQGIEAL